MATSLPATITESIRSGEVLAGDDLTGDALVRWFAEEKEAFYEGDAGNSDVDPWYAYMRYVNTRLGFPFLRNLDGRSASILVVGPGSGIEICGLASRHPAWTWHFLEASDQFKGALKTRYPRSIMVDASASGDIRLQDRSLDAICAFSVLHHIPNVRHVLREFWRVLKPGAVTLIREPCSSMGDWRLPRSATPNERGLSRRYVVPTAREIGFDIVQRPVPILLSPFNALLKAARRPALAESPLIYWIDRATSALLSLNDFYWRDTWRKRFGPSAYFYVLGKPLAEPRGAAAPH